jgi:hypothetical protein
MFSRRAPKVIRASWVHERLTKVSVGVGVAVDEKEKKMVSLAARRGAGREGKKTCSGSHALVSAGELRGRAIGRGLGDSGHLEGGRRGEGAKGKATGERGESREQSWKSAVETKFGRLKVSPFPAAFHVTCRVKTSGRERKEDIL